LKNINYEPIFVDNTIFAWDREWEIQGIKTLGIGNPSDREMQDSHEGTSIQKKKEVIYFFRETFALRICPYEGVAESNHYLLILRGKSVRNLSGRV